MGFWSDNPTITAAVVGALAGGAAGAVPAISKGALDNWAQTRRLRFERNNAHQQKLMDAQSALLDELGSVCWKFRYDAIKVSWYWRHSQFEAYEVAARCYLENCWTSLSQIRFNGTRAGRLFSRAAVETVETFYKEVDEVDKKIAQAIMEQDVKKRTHVFDNVYPKIEKDMRMQIVDLISDLAESVDLTPPSSLPRLPGLAARCWDSVRRGWISSK
jgi:hypothetical protein